MSDGNAWRQHSVLIVATMLQQTLVADRAFGFGWLISVLWLLVIASCLVASRGFNDADKLSPSFADKIFKIAWWIAAAIVFAAAAALMLSTERASIVIVAKSLTLALMIGQIVLVATRGIYHFELLVMGAIVQVLSLVCTTTAMTIFRQVAEGCATIALFALMADMVANGRAVPLFAGGRRLLRSTIVVILLSIIILLTRPLAVAGDAWIADLLLSLDQALFEAALDAKSRIANRPRYVDTASLNDVVDQFDDDSQGIAIRVSCGQRPGYLRGRVFDHYVSGQWLRDPTMTISDDRGDVVLSHLPLEPIPGHRLVLPPVLNAQPIGLLLKSASLSQPESRLKNTFLIASSDTKKMVAVEVANDPSRGPFYFMPLGTVRVDGVGKRLLLDPHLIPIGGLDTKETYVATIQEPRLRTMLSVAMRESLLRVPPNLPTIIIETAAKIGPPDASPRALARLTSEFFQHLFKYSTDRQLISKSVDPIANFLQTRHAAHCEYFASATTLILRSRGIPARYVTGYVIDEYSDESECWLGRNRDAHAWVEAFDNELGSWFVVESTPERSYSSFDFSDFSSQDGDSASIESASTESFLDRFDLLQLMRHGRWSEFFVELLEQVRIPLAMLTTGLIGVVWRQRKSEGQVLKDPFATYYKRKLISLDRLSKKLGFIRHQSETLYRFADRLELNTTSHSDGQAAEGHDLATRYRLYAEQRYRDLPPAL